MDPQIRKRATHDIIHRPCIAQQPRGQKIYGPDIPRKAYVAAKSTLVKNRAGEEVVSNTQLYIDGYLEMTALDLMVWKGRDYPVVAFSPFDGLAAGTGTTVVYL